MTYTLVVVPESVEQIRFMLVDEQGGVHEKRVAAWSDAYVSSLETFFQELGVTPPMVSKAVVVFGGESATAHRLATTLVNAFSFVLSIPVCGIAELTSEPLLLQLARTEPLDTFLAPQYKKPPNIT